MSKQAKDFDTRDTSERCADDQLLRKHRFAIHARPAGGEPVWVRDGSLYPESQARQVAQAHEARGCAGTC